MPFACTNSAYSLHTSLYYICFFGDAGHDEWPLIVYYIQTKWAWPWRDRTPLCIWAFPIPPPPLLSMISTACTFLVLGGLSHLLVSFYICISGLYLDSKSPLWFVEVYIQYPRFTPVLHSCNPRSLRWKQDWRIIVYRYMGLLFKVGGTFYYMYFRSNWLAWTWRRILLDMLS